MTNENSKDRYPGVIGEDWLQQDTQQDKGLPDREGAAIGEVVEVLNESGIVALRVGGQRSYGFMFDGSQIEIVERVWREKKRVLPCGQIDWSYRPVTSLKPDQMREIVDWRVLETWGLKEETVNLILELGAHTVVPIEPSKVPKHLITYDNDVPTISTIIFPPESISARIVHGVDDKVIVAGTSLNRTNSLPYDNSYSVIDETAGKGAIINLFLLTAPPEHSDEFYPMIKVAQEGAVEILRGGDNTLRSKIQGLSLPVI